MAARRTEGCHYHLCIPCFISTDAISLDYKLCEETSNIFTTLTFTDLKKRYSNCGLVFSKSNDSYYWQGVIHNLYQ